MFALLTPFLAAIMQAASFTCDKAIMNIKRINYQTYTAISFPMLVVFDGIIWLIFRPPTHWAMLSSTAGILVFLSIIGVIITNVLYYRALKDDHLSELNIISLTAALPVIIVNGLIFADERHLAIIIPALIAACVVLWSHWDEHRFHFAKHTPAFLWWLLFTTPLSAAAAKIILLSWSPIMLEFVRDGAVALVLFPLFYKSIKHVPTRGWWLFVATNALSATAWIMYFVAYQRLGIVHTALIFSLQPLLVYFSAVVILKEPFEFKKFIAFLVVLASIATAQIIG